METPDPADGLAKHSRWIAGLSIASFVFIALALVGGYIELNSQRAELADQRAELTVTADSLAQVDSLLTLESAELVEQRGRAQALVQASDPDTQAIDALVEAAIAAARERQWAVADSLYREALELAPNDAYIRGLKGFALYRSGNPDAAIRELERAAQDNPDDAWVPYNLALAYWITDRKDEAVAQLEHAVELDPTKLEALRGDVQFREFQSRAEVRALLADTR